MIYPGYTDWVSITSTKWVKRSESFLGKSYNEMCATKNARMLLDFLRPAVPVTDKIQCLK